MKHIKVTGCHDCDKKYKNLDLWMCKHPDSKDCMDIDIYINTNTIHPACPLDDYEEQNNSKYYELLHYIETKHPNESRHDTALRYIKEAERGRNG